MANTGNFQAASLVDDSVFFDKMTVPEEGDNWTLIEEPTQSDETLSQSQPSPSPIDLLRGSAAQAWKRPSWATVGFAASTAGQLAASQVQQSLDQGGTLRQLLDASGDIASGMSRASATLYRRHLQQEERRKQGMPIKDRKWRDQQTPPRLELLGKNDTEMQQEIVLAAEQNLGKVKVVDKRGMLDNNNNRKSPSPSSSLSQSQSELEHVPLDDSGAWKKPVEPGSTEAELRERCRQIWENAEEGWTKAELR